VEADPKSASFVLLATYAPHNRKSQEGTLIRSVVLIVAVMMAAGTGMAERVRAQSAPAASEPEPPRDPPPAIPATVLKDAAMIAQGEKIWQDQCTHCHGARAYPGKAPKLQPRTYKPEFVWDRVHNGFRAMPAWKEVYKPEEVLALVAYVLSDEFFP
jgi:mono/diheme cytochrome c family protein